MRNKFNIGDKVFIKKPPMNWYYSRLGKVVNLFYASYAKRTMYVVKVKGGSIRPSEVFWSYELKHSNVR